ncbi:tetratricopeptide repeat protein [Sphingomonas sp.]|uniref:tetratricopeptide repeat protein n=1 Tax=Sphingomonas sp. TaxID=28214 RepID=UPI0025F205D3|nr:tetratricopeptide repeat protein [Sphingomonas sp.]
MARTTRICSLALLLAGFGPVEALAGRGNPSALGLYARARVAGGSETVHLYNDALTAAPDQKTVALHAYRQAIISGDYRLALRAAQSLERLDFVPADGRLVLYIAALRDRDWQAARARLDMISRSTEFAFMVPILADWLTLAGVAADPIAAAPGAANRALTANDAYVQENHALLMLARGDVDGGSTLVQTLWRHDPYRSQSLRLTAAATLAKRRQRDAANRLLIADDRSTVIARGLIAQKHKLDIATEIPASGTAFLLSRMAGDLITQGSGRAAVTLARLAEFADPQNPRIALIAAGALALGKDKRAALALADRVAGDPVYGNDATSLRIDLLEAMGEVDQAVAEARERARGSINDLARVGDIEARRGNFKQAANIFQQVLAASKEPKARGTLMFAIGNALDRAGDWTAARPYLEQALTLMPGEPALLNELGYGLVVHGEDAERALGFLSAAAQIKPDSAAIMDSLGWANYRLGYNDLAIVGLERAVTLDNAEPEIGEHLGDAYWHDGRRIDARYSWAAARLQADGDMAARLDQKIARGLP